MSFGDQKGLDQTVRALLQDAEADADDFKQGPLKATVGQFEAMAAAEKKLDAFFAQKRVDISEKLCFSRKQVTTVLRLFVDSEVSHQDEGVAYIKLNVFGRLLLNAKPDVTDEEYFVHYRSSMAFERHFVKWFSFAENVSELKVEFADDSLKPAYFGANEKQRRTAKGTDGTHGFTIIRTADKAMTQFPLTCKISLILESQNSQFKLAPPLAAFLRRNYASRREIVDAIFDYSRTHNLLDGDSLRLDPTLRSLFRGVPDEKPAVPVHDISSHLKFLVFDAEEFEFLYTIHENAVLRQHLDVYDIKVAMPLEPMPDLIAFYVSKLVLNEEERKRSLLDEHGANLSPNIRSHEKICQMQEQIARKIAGVRTLVQRRDLFKQLAEDPTAFLEGYLKNWERVQEAQLKQGSVLTKRPLLEENELLGLLRDKYDVLLDREIDNFLKSKAL